MQLNDMLQRITAPNPGVMTGNGTNSYVITSANGNAMVIDPGPDIASHITALIAASGGEKNIKAIVLTHMHPDHSPAAMPLAKRSGARIYSAAAVDDPYQDKTLQTDIIVQHNQLLELDDIRLRCIYTPGHVDNHMCYLLENERILMTGDHMMQGSTVVIIPPHGNMKKYLDSLALLKDYDIAALAPGHGEFIHTPYDEIDGIIRHRLAREAKVRERLAAYRSGVLLEDLTRDVYDDVDPQLHLMASLSLLAHLLKLEEEGLAVQQNKLWSAKN